MPNPVVTRPRLAATTLCVVVGAALVAPLAQAAPTSVAVHSSVLGVVAALSPGNHADPQRELHVVVALHNATEGAQQHMFDQLYASGGARRYLTPAEFRVRFRPAAARLDDVRRFLTHDGLRVDAVYGADDVWAVSGTVAQAEQTFGVHIFDFVRDGRSFVAPTSAPRVPRNLGIASIVGLDTYYQFRHGMRAQNDCLGPAGCIGLLSARDLWSAYDLPAAYTGRGEAIGILGAGDVNGPIADLREYEQLAVLPTVPVTVVKAQGRSARYDDPSGRAEWAMDLEAATAMAPRVSRVVMYFGTSLANASLLADIAAWASDRHGPRQASMSITECEDTPLGVATGAFTATPEFVLPADRLLRQAAIEGRTLFAASGDLGSSCALNSAMPVNGNGVANEGVPIVNYPAASPYVVGVGGTVLDTTYGAAPRRILETAWTASGGGQSVSYPMPAYQRGVVPATITARPCLQNTDGSRADPTVPCRAVPDVAALSGDVISNGFAIVAGEAPNVQGSGTSLSAPLWAGIWARVQSARPPPYRAGLGFANPFLYRTFTGGPRSLFDIGGSSVSPPTTNGAYASGPGYDEVTGLGVPDGAALVAAARAGR